MTTNVKQVPSCNLFNQTPDTRPIGMGQAILITKGGESNMNINMKWAIIPAIAGLISVLPAQAGSDRDYAVGDVIEEDRIVYVNDADVIVDADENYIPLVSDAANIAGDAIGFGVDVADTALNTVGSIFSPNDTRDDSVDFVEFDNDDDEFFSM
ncbi:MAG: hypothetical protein SGI71_11275 [Verrucomicrobiota bacterium]|nr:hypothetical protein [Verrucomicrobiota bacterium]